VFDTLAVEECVAPALELSVAPKALLSLTASLAFWLCESELEYADVSVVVWL
jgi:hypothetical protein